MPRSVTTPAQSNCRVDPRGSPSGAVARHPCHSKEQSCNSDQRDRIPRCDTIKLMSKDMGCGHCASQPNDQSGKDQSEAMAKDEPKDVTSARPQRQPQSDLPGLLIHQVGQHAV